MSSLICHPWSSLFLSTVKFEYHIPVKGNMTLHKYISMIIMSNVGSTSDFELDRRGHPISYLHMWIMKSLLEIFCWNCHVLGSPKHDLCLIMMPPGVLFLCYFPAHISLESVLTPCDYTWHSAMYAYCWELAELEPRKAMIPKKIRSKIT